MRSPCTTGPGLTTAIRRTRRVTQRSRAVDARRTERAIRDLDARSRCVDEGGFSHARKPGNATSLVVICENDMTIDQHDPSTTSVYDFYAVTIDVTPTSYALLSHDGSGTAVGSSLGHETVGATNDGRIFFLGTGAVGSTFDPPFFQEHLYFTNP